MSANIPYDKWNPLSLEETVTLFRNAPFRWFLAGGYAVEQFLGRMIRSHDDIDIAVFRDEQLKVQQWLKGWQLYAADPPGTLRKWEAGEYLPSGIHDIWGHKAGSEAWQLQLMLDEVDGNEWFSRRNPAIRGKREDLVAVYNGIPCTRIEVQLLYKARMQRPKDDQDFYAALPHLNRDAHQWLKENLLLLHPEGHDWLASLS
jgi:hypothetical protein